MEQDEQSEKAEKQRQRCRAYDEKNRQKRNDAYRARYAANPEKCRDIARSHYHRVKKHQKLTEKQKAIRREQKTRSNHKRHLEKTGIARRHRVLIQPKPCSFCSKIYLPKCNKSVFCSKDCYTNSNPLPVVDCGFCKKPFKQKRGHKHCSRFCRDSNTKFVTLTCLNCLETFMIQACLINKGRSGKYCSTSCSEEYRVGPASANWQGGKSLWNSRGYRGPNWKLQSKKTRERDGFCCKNPECGKTQVENGRELPVHHIIPYWNYTSWRKANRLSNLVTLCDVCHGKEEAKPKETQTLLFFGKSSVKGRNGYEDRIGMRGSLISPNGVIYDFKNLKRFVREHGYLFKPIDVIYKKVGDGSWCNALGGLRRLFAKKDPLRYWKGWKKYSHESKEEFNPIASPEASGGVKKTAVQDVLV